MQVIQNSFILSMYFLLHHRPLCHHRLVIRHLFCVFLNYVTDGEPKIKFEMYRSMAYIITVRTLVIIKSTIKWCNNPCRLRLHDVVVVELAHFSDLWGYAGSTHACQVQSERPTQEGPEGLRGAREVHFRDASADE